MVNWKGRVAGPTRDGTKPERVPRQFTRSPVGISIILVAALAVFPSCLLADSDCPPETTGAFSKLARDLDSGAQPNPELPPLNNCDPDGTLLDVIVPSLGRAIVRAFSEKDVDSCRYMASVLAEVKEAYQAGNHKGNFFAVSRAVFEKLHGAGITGLPPEPEDTPAVRQRFEAMDKLMGYLQECPIQPVEECPRETTDAFLRLARAIDSGDQPNPDLPLLDTCDPKGELRDVIAPPLGRAIVKALKENDVDSCRYMASVLAEIKEVYEAGEHKDDFFAVSRAVYVELQGAGLTEPPPKPEDTETIRQSFQAMDELMEYLQKHSRNPWWPPTGWHLVVLALALPSLLISVVLVVGRKTSRSQQQADPIEDLRAEVGRLEKNLVEPLKQDVMRLLTGQKTLGDVTQRLEYLEGESAKYQGTPAQLQKLTDEVTAIHDQVESLKAQVRDLDSQVKALIAKIDRSQEKKIDHSQENVDKLGTTRPQPVPLEGWLLETEQHLLREDWERFLASPALRELGELVESFATDEDHEILLGKGGLLNELPGAVESDPQLNQICASKLTSLRMYNQQLRQLSLVRKLAQEKLPTSPEDQKRLLLRLRDSSHLLSTLRNTELGARILRFRPSKWCAEELPDLADLFLRFYQTAQTEGRSGPEMAKLEKARKLILKALQIANLEPIDIVIGRTRFESEKHVGRSRTTDERYPDGTIVGVVRNGFRNIRDDKVVVQPQVIVNRL